VRGRPLRRRPPQEGPPPPPHRRRRRATIHVGAGGGGGGAPEGSPRRGRLHAQAGASGAASHRRRRWRHGHGDGVRRAPWRRTEQETGAPLMPSLKPCGGHPNKNPASARHRRSAWHQGPRRTARGAPPPGFVHQLGVNNFDSCWLVPVHQHRSSFRHGQKGESSDEAEHQEKCCPIYKPLAVPAECRGVPMQKLVRDDPLCQT